MSISEKCEPRKFKKAKRRANTEISPYNQDSKCTRTTRQRSVLDEEYPSSVESSNVAIYPPRVEPQNYAVNEVNYPFSPPSQTVPDLMGSIPNLPDVGLNGTPPAHLNNAWNFTKYSSQEGNPFNPSQQNPSQEPPKTTNNTQEKLKKYLATKGTKSNEMVQPQGQYQDMMPDSPESGHQVATDGLQLGNDQMLETGAQYNVYSADNNGQVIIPMAMVAPQVFVDTGDVGDAQVQVEDIVQDVDQDQLAQFLFENADQWQPGMLGNEVQQNVIVEQVVEDQLAMVNQEGYADGTSYEDDNQQGADPYNSLSPQQNQIVDNLLRY